MCGLPGRQRADREGLLPIATDRPSVAYVLFKARFFASLDLLMGYHQVEVEPADGVKTGFLIHRGLFIYNVMQFKLCNAPATFQG